MKKRSSRVSGNQSPGTLRQRILAFVGALILLSLLGSSVSVFRITQVSSILDAINRVSVPLGKWVTQLQSDADVYRRELDRSLGFTHWKDAHWKPRPAPPWIEGILDNELAQISSLVSSSGDWTEPASRGEWQDWNASVNERLQGLRVETQQLYNALERGDQTAAAQLYTKWVFDLEEWRRQLQWGAVEYDRVLRRTFSVAESRVAELRMGLEMALVLVVCLSLLLLWVGERALRPLGALTTLAREITRRGLKREDKAIFPDLTLGRKDEVSQLAREFHHMATALLERERMVESQKARLQEQNQLLLEMGGLNKNVLNSIESILLVTDLQGRITQANPVALRWLGVMDAEQIRGTSIEKLPKISEICGKFPGGENWLLGLGETREAQKLDLIGFEDRLYGGTLMTLRQEAGAVTGAIIVLEDRTEEVQLQTRLQQAEHLAAVGRMSAQVAHEVRNPLHSIGLEAEMALELASQMSGQASGQANGRSSSLRQSLQSILASVDRLEKITQNYLKLSRLSAGEKKAVGLNGILESVLAVYAPLCEAQGVKVDWSHESRVQLEVWGDADLLEQAFGNLMRNALQALEDVAEPSIFWSIGVAESGRLWVSIEDNGPGIPQSIRSKLFTPFLTTRAQGTGLGLSFTKKVFEDHGGKISYNDRNPGACFEVTLPAHSGVLQEWGSAWKGDAIEGQADGF